METSSPINKAHLASIKQKVFSEQVKILHHNLLASVPANFICAAIALTALYNKGYDSFIWPWFAAIIFVSISRLLSLYAYRYHPKKDSFHLSIFIFGMTLSAMLWGVIDSVFMPANDPIMQLIIIVLVTGVTAGGIQTLNANLLSCLIYLFTILLPLSIWIALQNTFYYLLLDTAVLAYFGFMLITSIRGNKLLSSALSLKYENLALAEKLSDSNNKLFNAYKVQEKHEHKIIMINKMNDMLQACKETKEAYEVIQLSGKELFKGLNGGLFMLNPVSHELELVTYWGDHTAINTSFEVQDCWALRKGHEYHINNPAADLLCHHFNLSPNASICLPLSVQTRCMGLFVLYSLSGNNLSGEQLQLANTFSEVIQLSLTNIKLRETLYEQSIHDPLTGLFNRRYLDETLLRELQRAIREKKSLCVAMLDIDYFKKFNDTNGHDAGDEALRYVGMMLQEHFRGTDISCRYGGEEFLVVLVNTDLSSAMLRLEYLRNAIKNGELYNQGHILPRITISIGVAEAPQHGITAKDIIHAADMALYSAKKEGRDRIMAAISTVTS